MGIDIGSGHVKVVVLEQRGGRLHLAGAGAAELPEAGTNGSPPDPGMVARAIRNALDVAGARGVDGAMCALPRHGVAVRDLQLPGPPSDQLAQAAVMESARTLPFPAEEEGTGVWLRGGPDGTTAQVAVARGEVVAAYRGAVQAAGLRLDGLGVSTLAVGAVARDPGGAWVLVDIGARSTTLDLFEDGVVRMGRTLLVGGEDLTRALAEDLGCDEETAEERKRAEGLDAIQRARGREPEPAGGSATEAWLEHVTTGVRLLLAAYAAQRPDAAVSVRLAGGGGALRGLAAHLESELGVPVSALEADPPLVAGTENPLQYAAALGMALAHARQVQTVDLVAAMTRRAAAQRQQRLRGMIAGFLVVAVLASGAAWGYRAWRVREAEARERAALARAASEAIREADRLRTRQKTLLAQVQALRAALRPAHPWVEVLNELAARAPAGVWLTGIEVERGKPLVVRGTALQAAQAADFATALARSPILAQAQLSYANDAEIDRRRVTQFGVVALIRGNAPEARVRSSRPVAGRRTSSEEGP